MKKKNTNNSVLMKFIFASIILASNLLIVNAGLIFEHSGTKQFELNESGNILSATIKENVTTSPSSNALIFAYQDQNAIWLENDHSINLLGDYEEQTSVFPEIGLIVENSNGEQVAEIATNGKLFTIGQSGILISATTYIDATGVFQYTVDSPINELVYHNINTPLGTEGRKDVKSGKVYYYIQDHLGSTRSVITDDGSGTAELAEYALYHSYGNKTSPTTSEDPPFLETFTGKEYDSDNDSYTPGIDLYYFGARYLDPDIGLWVSTDPKEQFNSPYTYLLNPIILVDPNGEDGWFAAGLIIGAVIGAYTTTSSMEGSYNPGDWNWDGETLGSLVYGGALGAFSAYAGGVVGGAVGAASGGGIGGAISGGFVGGAIGAAINYPTTMPNMGEFNAESFYSGLLMSMVKSGGTGAAIGGSLYGMKGIISSIIQRERVIPGAAFQEDPEVAQYVYKVGPKRSKFIEKLSNAIFMSKRANWFKREYGLISRFDEEGKFVYRFIRGNKNSVPFQNVKNKKIWEYNVHSHNITGSVPSGYGITESGRLTLDYSRDYGMASQWVSQGYKGTFGMFNVANDIGNQWYGFYPEKSTWLKFWKMEDPCFFNYIGK